MHITAVKTFSLVVSFDKLHSEKKKKNLMKTDIIERFPSGTGMTLTGRGSP